MQNDRDTLDANHRVRTIIEGHDNQLITDAELKAALKARIATLPDAQPGELDANTGLRYPKIGDVVISHPAEEFRRRHGVPK